MVMTFEHYAKDIKKFCEKKGYDFEKAKRMVKSAGPDSLALQYFDPDYDSGLGLLDETPLPLVLEVHKMPNGQLLFEMTEHTDRYLSYSK